MTGMSDTLAQVFGTRPAAAQHSAEDLEKQANIEFFTKLCMAENINPELLSEEKLGELWKIAMQVKANSEGGGGQSEAEKTAQAAEQARREAAEKEWTEKRAAAKLAAESDAMGRIMAHAYVDELRKIAQQEGGGLPPQFMNGGEEKDKEEKKKKEKEEEEEKEASSRKAAEIIAAFQSKQASASSTQNLDELASRHAVAMLKEAGVDETVARERVKAACVLGLKESTKIASAESQSRAMDLRALEICEAAGFPVDWSEA